MDLERGLEVPLLVRRLCVGPARASSVSFLVLSGLLMSVSGPERASDVSF